MARAKQATTADVPLSWEPVRNGAMYCAPACGGGCTYDAYVRATIDAQLLAQVLGPAWTPNVFENLGWHTHVRACGNALTISMHVRDDVARYSLIANVGHVSFALDGANPLWLVHAAINKLAAARAEIDETLGDVLRSLRADA